MHVYILCRLYIYIYIYVSTTSTVIFSLHYFSITFDVLFDFLYINSFSCKSKCSIHLTHTSFGGGPVHLYLDAYSDCFKVECMDVQKFCHSCWYG